MRRQVIISIILIVLLLGGGGTVAAWLISTAPNPPASEPARQQLIVRAVRVKPQTVVEPVEGYGTVRAERYARITSQVSAEARDIPPNVKDGAAVEAGAVLVRLDDREYQQQLRRAQSQLDMARAELAQLDVEQDNLRQLIITARNEVQIADQEYARVRDFFERGTGDQREVDLKRLDYERARRLVQGFENQLALLPQQRAKHQATVALREAEVQLAELDVERCTIAAPFAGRIDRLEVEIGERVQVGTPLLSLLDPDDLEIPVELPISQRHKIAVDRGVHLMLDSRDGIAWKGEVQRIAPQADHTNRSFQVFIEVDNTAQADPLMPGMFVHALIDGPTLEDVFLVPRGCVQSEAVFVYREGTAHACLVQIERNILDQSVVTGLQADDVVITSNLDSLYDGAAVAIGQWEENGVLLARDPGRHADPVQDPAEAMP